MFAEEDQTLYFSTKVLSPETLAFAKSLRDPSPSPLISRDYSDNDKPWSLVSKASSVAAALAVYSTALTDLLIRADELEVTEEDRATFRELLLFISSRSYTTALRTQLCATKQRRLIALQALSLPKDFNGHAVNRLPRDGPFIFGGRFLDAVDSDISMNLRAKEVARGLRPRSFSFRGSRARGGASASSRPSGFRRFASRGRGFTR